MANDTNNLKVAYTSSNFFAGFQGEPLIATSEENTNIRTIDQLWQITLDEAFSEDDKSREVAKQKFTKWYYENINVLKELYEPLQIQKQSKKSSTNEAERLADFRAWQRYQPTD